MVQPAQASTGNYFQILQSRKVYNRQIPAQNVSISKVVSGNRGACSRKAMLRNAITNPKPTDNIHLTLVFFWGNSTAAFLSGNSTGNSV